MRKDQRLSRALHVLIHMGNIQEPVSSDIIARAINTNPVVIRRLFQGLKSADLVKSSKGVKGGWELQRPLNEITLLSVFEAIGSSELFSLGWETESNDCLIEKAVNLELKNALEEAKIQIKKRFSEVSLDKIAPQGVQDFRSTHL